MPLKVLTFFPATPKVCVMHVHHVWRLAIAGSKNKIKAYTVLGDMQRYIKRCISIRVSFLNLVVQNTTIPWNGASEGTGFHTHIKILFTQNNFSFPQNIMSFLRNIKKNMWNPVPFRASYCGTDYDVP